MWWFGCCDVDDTDIQCSGYLFNYSEPYVLALTVSNVYFTLIESHLKLTIQQGDIINKVWCRVLSKDSESCIVYVLTERQLIMSNTNLEITLYFLPRDFFNFVCSGSGSGSGSP